MEGEAVFPTAPPCAYRPTGNEGTDPLEAQREPLSGEILGDGCTRSLTSKEPDPTKSARSAQTRVKSKPSWRHSWSLARRNPFWRRHRRRKARLVAKPAARPGACAVRVHRPALRSAGRARSPSRCQAYVWPPGARRGGTPSAWPGRQEAFPRLQKVPRTGSAWGSGSKRMSLREAVDRELIQKSLIAAPNDAEVGMSWCSVVPAPSGCGRWWPGNCIVRHAASGGPEDAAQLLLLHEPLKMMRECSVGGRARQARA